MGSVPQNLDHLVYATPALADTLGEIEERFGVSPTPGGAHPEWGTRNAILPLGPGTYLEIIGPDLARAPDARPRPFEIASLRRPKLVTWAAKATGLPALVARAASHGIRLGLPKPGRRQRPDGTTLSWELTDPFEVTPEGLIPFFIDWGASPHPAGSSPGQVVLTEFQAVHPDPVLVRRTLALLNLELSVRAGATAGLLATFRTPRGLVTLR